ncbi:hypothetical protein GL218_05514 [Daldinia childiae]|uniref:uncharacterized protein n=1 Tax=Daldinia childiae TaxID=326645 RepID=UPI001446AC1C|nr:uncharacterized protein GL218_05514 [Daldinia childiae]KAF3058399.1 hypothetical protein GL218_05514 [Daldinia childiae]
MLVRSLDRVSMVGDDKSRYELVDLFLTKGSADVNSCDGRPLALVAAEGRAKILELLISYRPQVKSLRSALEPTMRVGDPALRMRIIELVLAGTRGDTSAIDDLKATALALAARFQHIDILELLVQSGVSIPSINAGLAEAISGGDQLFKAEGLEIIQFFLEHGAFCQAVRLFESDAIELLSTSANPAAVDMTFKGIIEHSDDWHAPDDCNIWLTELLLERGPSSETVMLALIRAIQAYVSGRSSEILIDMILGSREANVNYNKAEALKIAARAGNVSLLKKLASSGATREILTYAFADAVVVKSDEDTVLSLINALILGQNAECRPGFSAVLSGRSPPIIECLITHPESVKLVTIGTGQPYTMPPKLVV